MRKLLLIVPIVAIAIVCMGAGFPKWVDFNVSHTEIERARQEHIKTGVSTAQILAKKKYQCAQSFHAVLDGIICSESGDVIGYHPIAKGFWHSGHDDFGNSRSYGFKRKHLGHDLYGSVGAPIIAVEGGTITELGWNRYGGWRVGIRSDDSRRYYYYAHLRSVRPYPEYLEKGARVSAGDIIGFLGNTGYSTRPGKNMSGKPHLHFGMQIIFDESQEDGNREIWIDVYNICRFLANHESKVSKDPETGDWERLTNSNP